MLTLFPRLTPKYIPPPEPEPVKTAVDEPPAESVTSAEETREILSSVSQSVESPSNEPLASEQTEAIAAVAASSGSVYVYVVPEKSAASAAIGAAASQQADLSRDPADPSDLNAATTSPRVGSATELYSAQDETPMADTTFAPGAEASTDVTADGAEAQAPSVETLSILEAALAVFRAEPIKIPGSPEIAVTGPTVDSAPTEICTVPPSTNLAETIGESGLMQKLAVDSDSEIRLPVMPVTQNANKEIVLSDAEIENMLDPSAESALEEAAEPIAVEDAGAQGGAEPEVVAIAPAGQPEEFARSQKANSEAPMAEVSAESVEAAPAATESEEATDIKVSEPEPRAIEEPAAGLLDLPRVPEPEVMADADEVEAYASAAAQAYLNKLDDSFVDHAVQLVHGRIRGRALDIGTGPGQIVLKLARRLSLWKFVGADLSPAMVAQAQKNLAAETGVAGRVEFIEADGNWLEFPRGTFDLVICNSVLHHFAEPQHLLLELARLAKPRGAILLRDLRRPSRFMYPLHVRWHGRYYSGTMRQLYRDSVRASYTFAELEKLVQKSPLRGARIFKFGSTHIGIERPYNWQ